MKKVLVVLLAVVLSCSLSGCFLALLGDSSETSKTITDVSGAGVSDSPSATQEKQVAKVGQTVTGDKWAISLLSAKTFTEIKDEYYTDTPEEGKIYLVLFFEVENVSNEDDYFNYFNIESYVDGYNSSIKIIMNKPDGVDTLTGDIAAGKKLKGQLTWEVSPSWSELEVSYKDNVWTGSKAATFNVTPSDLTA